MPLTKKNPRLIELAERKGFKPYGHLKYNYYIYLCLIQQWLRDNHNIDVWVIPVQYNTRYMVKGKIDRKTPVLLINEWTDTYEEGLELGIEEALKLI